MKNPARVLVSGIALTMALASLADAQTLQTTGLGCNNKGAVATMGALACAGAFSGNNMNQQEAVFNQLTSSFGSYTGPGSLWSYVGDPNFTGSTAGTINFTNPVTGFFVVAIKSANGFSLYLWNGGATGLASVNFTDIGTAVNGHGNVQAISHASLYRFTGATSSTPEPATLILVGSGLAGLAFWRRRRRED